MTCYERPFHWEHAEAQRHSAKGFKEEIPGTMCFLRQGTAWATAPFSSWLRPSRNVMHERRISILNLRVHNPSNIIPKQKQQESPNITFEKYQEPNHGKAPNYLRQTLAATTMYSTEQKNRWLTVDLCINSKNQRTELFAL